MRYFEGPLLAYIFSANNSKVSKLNLKVLKLVKLEN